LYQGMALAMPTHASNDWALAPVSFPESAGAEAHAFLPDPTAWLKPCPEYKALQNKALRTPTLRFVRVLEAGEFRNFCARTPIRILVGCYGLKYALPESTASEGSLSGLPPGPVAVFDDVVFSYGAGKCCTTSRYSGAGEIVGLLGPTGRQEHHYQDHRRHSTAGSGVVRVPVALCRSGPSM